MLAGRGLAKVITGGQNTAASNDTFRWLANGYVFGIPVVFLLAVAIVILVGLLVRRSALGRSEEHTSELQSRGHLVCRLLLEKKNKSNHHSCTRRYIRQ